LIRHLELDLRNIPHPLACREDRHLSPHLGIAYNLDGPWTDKPQMSLNGKRDGFEVSDYSAFASTAGLKRGRDKAILEEVRAAISMWPEFAERAGVKQRFRQQIASTHRVE
jgi:serine/threonine-protein kinase HipA